MVAQLICVVVKAPDSAATDFSEKYLGTNIGPNQLSDYTQTPCEFKPWIFGGIGCFACQGLDSPAIGTGIKSALLQETYKLIPLVSPWKLDRMFPLRQVLMIARHFVDFEIFK